MPSRPRRPPNRRSRSCPSWTALQPATPVRSASASSSGSLSVAAPWRSRRSRGQSARSRGSGRLMA
ncbi:Uncharacterised protein [Bordetella pertussis]|nr:Uncharacterised protein [Bordetella pertussis]